mmetsp:Transcript_49884/g.159543  ORF Transcript_49884/g.159543 Transcript_49884/m.159543 type:complete len:231 (-) Transcript_49884:1103-1795(-)
MAMASFSRLTRSLAVSSRSIASRPERNAASSSFSRAALAASFSFFSACPRRRTSTSFWAFSVAASCAPSSLPTWLSCSRSTPMVLCDSPALRVAASRASARSESALAARSVRSWLRSVRLRIMFSAVWRRALRSLLTRSSSRARSSASFSRCTRPSCWLRSISRLPSSLTRWPSRCARSEASTATRASAESSFSSRCAAWRWRACSSSSSSLLSSSHFLSDFLISLCLSL